MLKLNSKDLDLFKNNLIKKRATFKILSKRSEHIFVRDNVNLAKVESKNKVQIPFEAISLFSQVKKSINKKLKQQIKNSETFESIISTHPSQYFNRLLFYEMADGEEFYLIDVKHCYWRIAYLQGYIDRKTYESVIKNLDPKYKLWRNMSLSCIIAPKKVTYFVNGRDKGTIEEDTTIYKIVYSNIRFTAWNLFGRICDRIGKENVLGYNTDGIMVFHKDIPKVTSSLAQNRLKYTLKKCYKSDFNKFTTENGKDFKF